MNWSLLRHCKWSTINLSKPKSIALCWRGAYLPFAFLTRILMHACKQHAENDHHFFFFLIKARDQFFFVGIISDLCACKHSTMRSSYGIPRWEKVKRLFVGRHGYIFETHKIFIIYEFQQDLYILGACSFELSADGRHTRKFEHSGTILKRQYSILKIYCQRRLKLPIRILFFFLSNSWFKMTFRFDKSTYQCARSRLIFGLFGQGLECALVNNKLCGGYKH